MNFLIILFFIILLFNFLIILYFLYSIIEILFIQTRQGLKLNIKKNDDL